MDLITDHIAELKNMVSLRYVDPNLRDKAINTLRSHHQQETTIPGMQICLAYIFKVEEVHDKMMQQVSQFLQQLTPFINECQHTIESSQQQLAQNAKMRSRELSQQQDMEYDMKRTMEMMGRQLNLRDQQTKELLLRIEEKDSIIYNLERQQSDYFKKMETDFEKQHKALQQSFNIITRLEEQNKALKKENMRLVELQLNRTLSVHAIYQSPQIHIQDSNQQVNCSIQRSPHQEQNELHQCSLISSRSEGLSQFEGVHADENEIEQKQEFVLGQRQGSPALAKVETLKELLNVSVQKEYKLQYNNYESMQQRDQKQNYRANWLRGSKSNSKQKCEQWAVTNSIQLIENYQMSKKCVKEFKLALHGNSTQLFKKSVNPYYIYFLIASQNVKIRSEHFEAMCSIEAGPCWQVLMQKAVPLHEWQGEIEKYLVERCGH